MYRPSLPDGFDVPQEVNGWLYDPETNKNGHAWYADDRQTSVAVFRHFDRVCVKVTDERVGGFENNVEVYTDEIPEDVEPDGHRQSVRVALGIEHAVDWMRSTAPDEWSHPDVCESVFDAPAGHVLEQYYLEQRETVVYYRREGSERVTRLAGIGAEDLDPETAPYLYIHVWNRSGNATVAVAPFLRAHGPGSKHPEIESAADTPEDCGLYVALTVARQWAREQPGVDEATEPTVGQSDLSGWSA